jgi:hypothetical protein
VKTVWIPLAGSGMLDEYVVLIAGYAMVACRWLHEKLYYYVSYFPALLPAYETGRKK